MTQDTKEFQNSTGYWSHTGSFSVQLTDDALTHNVPGSARIVGRVVHVPEGEVGQSIGGIQMRSRGQDFAWGYNFIKAIRDGEGKLIWVNNHFR